MESRAIREDTTTPGTKKRKQEVEKIQSMFYNIPHASLDGEKGVSQGDEVSDQGSMQKEKRRKQQEKAKNEKTSKVPGLDENEGTPLHYTPIVWNQIPGIIGDVPPARSFHTATAVPAHIRTSQQDNEKGEKEEEETRVGCEQILIIGGKRNQDDEGEDSIHGDVYLLTLSDEETILSAKLEPTGEGPDVIESHSANLLPNNTAILVFGGYLNNSSASDEIFLLELNEMRWSKHSVEGPKPTPRFNHATVMAGSLLFVFAGQDEETELNDTWVLDTEKWQWYPIVPKPGSRLPSPRCGHSLVKLPIPSSSSSESIAGAMQLVVFGGATSDAEECNSDLWMLDIPEGWHPSSGEALQWTEATDKIDFMGLQREGHSATPFGGLYLVLGGVQLRHKKTHYYRTSAWLNPSSFVLMEGEKGVGEAPVVKGHSATLLHIQGRTALTRSQETPFADHVFVFGGENRRDATADCYLVSKAKSTRERKISTHLNLAQYYNNHMYSDLLIKVIETDELDNETKQTLFYAQKSILSDRCEYFKNMFNSGMKEALSKCIEIRGIQWELFEYLLQYLYKIDITKDIDATSAVHLWKLADLYSCRGLKDLCLEVIKRSMTIQDLANTYEGGRATIYTELEKGLRTICMEFMAAKPEQLVMVTPEFALAMISEMYTFFGNNKEYPSRTLLWALQFHADSLPLLTYALNYLYIDDVRKTTVPSGFSVLPSRKMNKELSRLAVQSLLEKNVANHTADRELMEASMTLIHSLVRYLLARKPVLPQSQLLETQEIVHNPFVTPKKPSESKCQLDDELIRLLIRSLLLLVSEQRGYESTAEEIIRLLSHNVRSLFMGIEVLLENISENVLAPTLVSFATRITRKLRNSMYEDPTKEFVSQSLVLTLEKAKRAALEVLTGTDWQHDPDGVATLCIPLLKTIRNLVETGPEVVASYDTFDAVLQTVCKCPSDKNVLLWAERIVLSMCRGGEAALTAIAYGPTIETIMSTLASCEASVIGNMKPEIVDNVEKDGEAGARGLALAEALRRGNSFVSNVSSETGPWECIRCTFINTVDPGVCVVCLSGRQATAPAPSVVQDVSTPAQKVVAEIMHGYLTHLSEKNSEKEKEKEAEDKEKEKEKEEEEKGKEQEKARTRDSPATIDQVGGQLQFVITAFSAILENGQLEGRRGLKDETEKMITTVTRLMPFYRHDSGLINASLQLLYIAYRLYGESHWDALHLQSIVLAMKDHQAHSGIQAIGLLALSQIIVNGSVKLQSAFLADPENLLSVLHGIAHLDNNYGLRVTDPLRTAIAPITATPEGPGAGGVILNFLQDVYGWCQNKNVPEVIHAATRAMALFCKHDEAIVWAKKIVAHTLVSLMETHMTDSTVIIYCCEGLASIEARTKLDSDNCYLLHNTEKISFLMGLVTAYKENHQVIAALAELFINLINADSGHLADLINAGAAGLIVEMMALINEEDPQLVKEMEKVLQLFPF